MYSNNLTGNIDGRYLSFLRLEDDIVLVSDNLDEHQVMLSELQSMSEQVGLTMNLQKKTKVMTSEKTPIHVGNNIEENVEEYIYL